MMNTTDEAMKRLYSRQNNVDEELGDGFSKDQHKHLERQHRHTWCIVLSTVVHILFTQTKYATLKRPLHNHNRHVYAQCEQLSMYSSSPRLNTPLWNALYTATTDMCTLSVNNCPCTPHPDQTHRSETPSTQPQQTCVRSVWTTVHVLLTQTKHTALKCPLHNHNRHVYAQCEQLSMYSSPRPNTPLWNALYTTTTYMWTLSVNNCPCTLHPDQTHRSEMPSTQPQHTCGRSVWTTVHVLLTQTKHTALKRPLHSHNIHVYDQCEQLSMYSSPRPNTPLWNALYTATTYRHNWLELAPYGKQTLPY